MQIEVLKKTLHHFGCLCRICHICRYATGTLRSLTSWSSLQRVLLVEDNALRGICVLILTSHRHQGCGVPWHYVWIIVTKHNMMSGEWRRPLWLGATIHCTMPATQHVMRQNHIETNETHESFTAHGFISQDVSRLNLVDTRTYSKHWHWYGVRDRSRFGFTVQHGGCRWCGWLSTTHCSFHKSPLIHLIKASLLNMADAGAGDEHKDTTLLSPLKHFNTNTGISVEPSLCRHCQICLDVTNQDHINILEGAYLYYQIQDSSRDPLTTAW